MQVQTYIISSHLFTDEQTISELYFHSLWTLKMEVDQGGWDSYSFGGDFKSEKVETSPHPRSQHLPSTPHLIFPLSLIGGSRMGWGREGTDTNHSSELFYLPPSCFLHSHFIPQFEEWYKEQAVSCTNTHTHSQGAPNPQKFPILSDAHRTAYSVMASPRYTRGASAVAETSH